MTEQELKELIWYGQGDTPPELALQWLNNIIEGEVAYESEHKDSGENYAYLITESWQYHNIDDSIWQYCLSKPEVFGAMDGLEKEELGEQVEVFYVMRPYHSDYHAFVPNDGLCLLQVPVSELEVYIDRYAAEHCGHDWETMKRVAPFTEYYLSKVCEDSLLYYATPGTSWCAVIEDSTLADILDSMREEKA